MKCPGCDWVSAKEVRLVRRPRVRIQWLMVVVIIAAILSWGMPALVSE